MTHALIRGNQVAESFHTLLPDSDDPIQSLSEKLRTLVLGENRTQVAEVRVFGSIDRFGTIREILKDLPFQVNLWTVQNVFYEIMETIYPAMLDLARREGVDAQRWIEDLERLGERLYIRMPVRP